MDAKQTAMIEYTAQPYPEDRIERLDEQSARIAELEAKNVVLATQRNAVFEAVLGEDWELSGSEDSASIVEIATARIAELEAENAALRAELAKAQDDLAQAKAEIERLQQILF